jgi:glutathione S-transferase
MVQYMWRAVFSSTTRLRVICTPQLCGKGSIARYLNDVLPGKSLIPSTPKDRARMDMIIGLVDSYGYGALTGGVAAYHLFPDFVGGKNEAMRKGGLENGRKVIELAMKTKGSSPFIAGDLSLADLYLAPIALLRLAHAGQGRAFQRARLCRLVDEDPSLAEFQGHPAQSWLTRRPRDAPERFATSSCRP